MGRTRRNSVVPFLVLGVAVSIGVVALTASRFGRRRAKAETVEAPKPEPRFKPAPPRAADSPRWDSPPGSTRAATFLPP